MHPSRYHAMLVTDIEDWGGRPGAVQARLQEALGTILMQAIAAAGVDGGRVRRTSRGDGAIVAFPADVPKETITADLVKALNRGLRLHADECPVDETIRLRVALHAGDVQDRGDEWAGAAVVTACRLVDSEVLHRVLAAAASAVLAVIVSDEWFDAVLRERWADPTGYDPVRPAVKDYDRGAWIRVPGMSHPPGLRESDRAADGSLTGADGASAPGADQMARGGAFIVAGRDNYGGNSGGSQHFGGRNVFYGSVDESSQRWSR